MEAEFRACVDEDRHQGRTVLLASHILSEVEALCDRVSIVRAGKTVESGTLEDLRHLTRTTISARVSGDPATLGDLAGVHDLQISDHRVELEVDSTQIGEVLSRITQLGVVDLTSHPPTLEELFMRHYRDEIES
jgi:ABC-2 type transport system ATP-binding protein